MVVRIYNRSTDSQEIEDAPSIIINNNILIGYDGDDVLFTYQISNNIRVDIVD
jgi:hypothetical protein